MAQIFKISGYLIDINDSHTKDDVRLSTVIYPIVLSIFKNPNNGKCFDRPLPEVGQKYRHFKIGKIVTVVGISRHTETEEVSVVYNYEGQIWNRPLEMFMSEVDRRKYPNVSQKYRFELAED